MTAEVASTPSDACTAACTSDGENAHGDRLDRAGGAGDDDRDSTLGTLAAALLNLSPADRAKLAAMLVAGQGNAALP